MFEKLTAKHIEKTLTKAIAREAKPKIKEIETLVQAQIRKNISGESNDYLVCYPVNQNEKVQDFIELSFMRRGFLVSNCEDSIDKEKSYCYLWDREEHAWW